MARIDVLPSIDIIRGLKGTLDFYLWRGLPCVRAWPRYRPARQTDASLAAALLFGAIIKAYSLTHGTVLEQLTIEARGIPRTARDIYVSGVYGNLHEASMSDFLTLLTESRDFLSDLTALIDALHSVATDAVDVHVHASVLPPDAATHTGQGTQLTALQKIDDLQDALESKALDRLIVRGEDQLPSIKGVLCKAATAVISGDDGFILSPAVPPNTYWLITTAVARDDTTPVTEIRLSNLHDAVDYEIDSQLKAFAAGERHSWTGLTLLDPSDTIRALFIGGLAGDNVRLRLTGLTMTKET